jgi:hypothetical protein
LLFSWASDNNTRQASNNIAVGITASSVTWIFLDISHWIGDLVVSLTRQDPEIHHLDRSLISLQVEKVAAWVTSKQFWMIG